MPKADSHSIRLSEIARHPALKAFFARGERDSGHEFAVPVDQPNQLDGGAAAERELEHV